MIYFHMYEWLVMILTSGVFQGEPIKLSNIKQWSDRGLNILLIAVNLFEIKSEINYNFHISS